MNFWYKIIFMYYVYILQCADKTYYVGSTDDLEKRLHAHNHLKSGAHYTKIRRPVRLVYQEKWSTYSKARAREAELKRLERRQKIDIVKRREYLENKASAYDLTVKKAEHFSSIYGFKYGKITVRNQKTRWGSCSRKGNLSFSYRIVLLPTELQDYLVVHELCHLKEFNHAKAFWDLVGKEIPNYKKLRKKLKSFGR